MKKTLIALAAVGSIALGAGIHEVQAQAKRGQFNLSSNLMLSWGTVTLEAAALDKAKGSAIVTFGVPYASTPFVVATHDNGDKTAKDWQARNLSVTRVNAKAFTVVGDAPNIEVTYIAVGPK